MKNSVLNQKNIVDLVLWLLFFLTAVPVGILAMYNHPSVDDDFCFAYMTRDYGFWEAQKLYYEGWSGRYISNMFFHATPLTFGVFWFVKVMPFLVFGFLFHALYTFFGEIFNPNPKNRLLLTATFLSIFIVFSSSVIDWFYWYSSVFIFPTSFGFFLYLIVIILRYYQPQYQRIKYWIALFAATLVFFIIGSNEVMMLFVIGFCGMVWLYIVVFEKRFDTFIFALVLIGLYFAYFWVVKAKGNDVRMAGGHLLGGAIITSFKNAITSTISDGLKWSIILLPFGYLFLRLLPEKKTIKPIFKVNVWVVILGLFAGLFLMFFVIHYGNDMGVPDRVKNVIFAVFLTGYVYVFSIIRYSYSINYNKFSVWINYGIIAIGITISIFFFGQNLRIMYADIRLGIAKRYDQEMLQRYQQVRTSKSDTVYVIPLKNIPKSLCFDELKTNEKHLWNRCYANYFEKKVVILK